MSKKRKPLYIILLALLALALLNYILPHHLNITAPADAYITITDGLAGTHYQITNHEEVTAVIRQLNELKPARKIKFNHAENGYMYTINILTGGSNENINENIYENIFQLTILGNNKILLDDYVYTANTAPLLDLLENIKQN